MSVTHDRPVNVESPLVSGIVVDLSVLDLGSHALRWQGGFADVYVAEHPKLGALALKRPKGVCLPGSSEYRHLEQEAAIWKQLIHPNVLRFIALYERDKAIYLVSPLLPNGTVPQYIVKYPDVPRAPFLCDLAKGLNYLHQQGIVHGDIKGNNVLVSSSVPVEGVVADFGLAKMVDDQTVSSQKGAGTPRWQSPELFTGGSRTYKSDVYAFGMTVYEIISGKLPFEEVPTYAIFFKVYNKERPAPVPRVSASGYSYTREWQVAQAAWDHYAEYRPSMDRIVQLLESTDEPQRIVKARMKVVCEKMPELTGYVSRTLNGEWGSQVVTREVDDAFVVTFDLGYPGPQAISVMNSAEGQNWLAMRFTTNPPDWSETELWATFTAASGTQNRFVTVRTFGSPGLDLLPLWECSESLDLTPSALGKHLETGLTLQPGGEPPHIFFVPNLMQHWGRFGNRKPARFVLEPLLPEESSPEALN